MIARVSGIGGWSLARSAAALSLRGACARREAAAVVAFAPPGAGQGGWLSA